MRRGALRRLLVATTVAALLAVTLPPGSTNSGAATSCWGQPVTINGATGTNGADVLMGLPAVAENIDALAGPDSVCGDSRDIAVDGGQGADRVLVEANNGLSIVTFARGDGPSAAVAGSDRVVVRSGAEVRSVQGDGINAPGAADTVLVAGFVSGAVAGDVATQGAPDIVAVLPAGDVGFVFGDLLFTGTGKGGRDTITLVGKAASVAGDGTLDDGGNDTIAITNGSMVAVRDAGSPDEGWVYGDFAENGDGGNDFMIIRGSIERGVMGDRAAGSGGNDFMRIYPAAVITGPVVGDGGYTDISGGIDGVGARGGRDTIVAWPGATIIGDVIGDASRGDGGNDRFSLGATISGSVSGDRADGDGGNDSIGIGGAAHVVMGVSGDGVDGFGGDDIIDISGRAGPVNGDVAGLDGGNDIIFIRSTANVSRINGDLVGGNGGDDRIVVNKGGAAGEILGDNASKNGGDDVIIVSGTVGRIRADAASLGGGNDTITINPAGVVNGNIEAPKGTNTITVYGTVNGDIICSPSSSLTVMPGAVITGTISPGCFT